MALLLIATYGLAMGGCDGTRLNDSLDPNLPNPAELECVEEGTTCPVAFTLPLGNGVNRVELRGDFADGAWEKGVPMQIDGTQWRAEVQAPDGKTIRYKFFVNGSEWLSDPNNPSKEADGFGGEQSLRTARCDYTVCPAEPTEPVTGTFDWRSAVMYFVFVDRFNDGDSSNNSTVPGAQPQANWQGGDWQGVIDKIQEGYFNKLGVNALWLTVPMDNTNELGKGFDGNEYTAYHGYWPSDLDKTEEHFGTLEKLKELVDEAHARGIKVLLDYAMNHVHASNPLVQQHPDWFWPLYYNDKECVCGGGCDWNNEYEQKRCYFTNYLPDWNFNNAEARAYSVNNAIEWVKKTGVDGFRLDAVKHIELQWLLDLRKRVKEEIEPQSGEHFYMVGETYESANRDILKYYVGKDRLDGQFDFPLRGVVVEKILRRSGTMHDLDAFLTTNDNYYPGVMSTFIGNHDIARVIHTAEDQPWGAWDAGDPWGNPPALPNYAAPFERMAVGFTFLYTTKGVPLVYYGDEIGMAGAGDPDNRRFMQWEGLSEFQLSLRKHLEKLGQIRRDHPALWRGYRKTLSVTNDTYSYALIDGDQTVYVGLNRGDGLAAVSGLPSKGRDLLSGAAIQGPQLTLQPRSSVVVVAED